MAEPDLTKLRQEIDRLDAILTDTLEKRMDVVQQVAAYKDARNMQVLDRERRAGHCKSSGNAEKSCLCPAYETDYGKDYGDQP